MLEEVTLATIFSAEISVLHLAAADADRVQMRSLIEAEAAAEVAVGRLLSNAKSSWPSAIPSSARTVCTVPLLAVQALVAAVQALTE